MRSTPRIRLTCLVVAWLVLTACTSQREPALAALGNIEEAIIGSSADAAKYAPDRWVDLQSKLGRLQAAFDRKDYAAVLAGAPEVLSEAHAVALAAAAGKEASVRALDAQWAALAITVPDYLTAIRHRLDLLGSKSSKRLAGGIDLGAAANQLDGAASLWSKAQAAFATGNMSEAVSTAQRLKANLETLAGSLMLNLAASG